MNGRKWFCGQIMRIHAYHSWNRIEKLELKGTGYYSQPSKRLFFGFFFLVKYNSHDVLGECNGEPLPSVTNRINFKHFII